MKKNVSLIILCLFPLVSNAGWKEDVTTLIENGKLDEARARINTYRRSNPADPFPVLLLARMDPDPDISQALYRECELLALKMKRPDRELASEAVFSRGEILSASGKDSLALDLYEKFVIDYPLSSFYPEAMLRLGGIMIGAGNLTGARDSYLKCYERAPKGSLRARAATGVMECHAAEEKWAEVLTQGRNVLEEEDENEGSIPRALELMSLALQKGGSPDNAEWYKNRITDLYPGSVQARIITKEIVPRKAPDVQVEGKETLAEETSSLSLPSSQTPPQQAAPPSTREMFTIQVAAFGNRENAYNLLLKLRNEKFESRVESVTISGKVLYRVFVGRYATRTDAESVLGRISAVTGNKAIVIPLE
jgi:tetratricopeptide (TPR) repeat protein